MERTPSEEVAAAIAELDQGDADATRAELTAAIDRLEEAGVIGPDARTEAEQSPLGGLARRMWAIERSAGNTPR